MPQPPFDMIVACDQNRGIGLNNQLPWRLPSDLKYFRNLTVGADSDRNAVIMGRKTWESIPAKYRPLPDRLNIVLTREKQYDTQANGVECCNSLDNALNLAQSKGVSNIFVIGGAQIYKDGFDQPGCRRLYVTQLEHAFDCDVFLPVYNERFNLVQQSDTKQENGINYRWEVYEKAK